MTIVTGEGGAGDSCMDRANKAVRTTSVGADPDDLGGGPSENRVSASVTINNSVAEVDLLAAPGVGFHYEIGTVVVADNTISDNVYTLKDGAAGTTKLKSVVNAGDQNQSGHDPRITFSTNTKVVVQLSTAIIGDIFVNVYGLKVTD